MTRSCLGHRRPRRRRGWHRRSPKHPFRIRRRRSPLPARHQRRSATRHSLRAERSGREVATGPQRSIGARWQRTLPAPLPPSSLHRVSSSPTVSCTAIVRHHPSAYAIRAAVPVERQRSGTRHSRRERASIERETASTIVTDLPGPLSSGPSRSGRPVATPASTSTTRQSSELHGRAPPNGKLLERQLRQV